MTMHIVRPSVPPLTASSEATTDLDALGGMSSSTEKVRVVRTEEPGPDPDRVLIMGGGIMGSDVDDKEQRFARRLARHLTHLTGRGTTVFEVIDPVQSVDDFARIGRSAHLERFDAVVLTTPKRMPVAAVNFTTQTSMRDLVAGLLELGSASTRVVLTGIDPRTVEWSPLVLLAGGRTEFARRANDDCANAARLLPGVGWAPLHDLGGRDTGAAGSAAWCDAGAQRVAVHLALSLSAEGAHVEGSARWHRNLPQQEQERVDTLRATGLRTRPADPLLDELVAMAANIYQAPIAGLQLLDDEEGTTVAGYAITSGTVWERRGLLCNTTIRSAEPLVVGDTTRDPRFEHFDVVQGELGLRFYAGIPIESADGVRLGALCVADTVARDVSNLDVARLRDIAALAQRRLQALADDA